MSNPLGPIYSLDFVLLLICAVGYYKAAELENKTPMVWANEAITRGRVSHSKCY